VSTDLDGLWRGLNNYVFVFKNKKDLIKWFGAIQAQDYLNSLWAIGLRLKNATEGDIEDNR